jgi:hypothetical protein
MQKNAIIAEGSSMHGLDLHHHEPHDMRISSLPSQQQVKSFAISGNRPTAIASTYD